MNFDIFSDSPKFREAQCAKVEDKDYFFPDTKHDEAERLPRLKQICGSCIHREECLEYALDKRIVYGFWGGYTADQRRSINRRGRRTVISKKAIMIHQMLWENKSANEIAITLECSSQYVYKVSAQLAKAAREGAIQSNQQTRNSSSDSSLLWWLAR
jgi:WhiB family redox-sensing transcriptional regulator